MSEKPLPEDFFKNIDTISEREIKVMKINEDYNKRVWHALKLIDLMEKQIKIEDDFMYAETTELKGTYSASIRRGILEKLYKEAQL